MGLTKVWNITDDTNPEVAPRSLMVLGRVLKPGQAVKIEEAHLKTAHKVHDDVTRGLLYIGMKPPASYLKVKKPPRAKVDVPRSHGPITAAEVKKAVLELKDDVHVEDKVEVKAQPVEEEAPVAEETTEKTDKKGKKWRQ